MDPIFFPAGVFTAERLADAGRLAGAFEKEVEAAGRRITGIVIVHTHMPKAAT